MEGAEPHFSATGTAGVMLLHDLAGTPQVFSGLATVLEKEGFAVDVPLLPGHGTELADLVGMSWDDWASAAQLAVDELTIRCEGKVVAVGIGMGAALACWASVMHPDVVGVVAINPRAAPVPKEAVDMLQSMLAQGAATVPPLGPDISDRTARVVEYKTVPVDTLISMFEALGTMADHWGEVVVPLLVVTSARDHRVSPYNAEFLAERAGGPVEHLVLERSFHLATLDVEHEKLEQAVVAFVRRLT
jgi:carboxylesterase